MTTPRAPQPHGNSQPAGQTGLLVFAWLFVGLPLAWGVEQTLLKSMALFH